MYATLDVYGELINWYPQEIDPLINLTGNTGLSLTKVSSTEQTFALEYVTQIISFSCGITSIWTDKKEYYFTEFSGKVWFNIKQM